MNYNTKFDWEVIENLYVTGGDEIGMHSLHDTYLPKVLTDVPALSSLKRQSSQRHWKKKRKQYRDNVSIETKKKVIEREADLRAKQIHLGSWLQTIGIDVLKELTKKDEDGNKVKITPFVALHIVKTGVQIERQALGMPDLSIKTIEGDADEDEIIGILANTIGVSEKQIIEILEDSPTK